MNSYKLIFLPVLLLFVIKVSAQYGCTDIQATNFDPLAVMNDGSCNYPLTTLPLMFKCYVDASQLDETSGIINHNNNFWTHVDNTDNSIYRIDTASDAIFQQITLDNSTNQDWEDITSDDNYIYVGDVGNNGGSRTNLRFYKVSKSEINPATTLVNAGKIKFSYSDQVVFNINNGNYYDCEAFFALNDSIHMFTKGWANRWTKHYVLPADTGTQIAQLVDSFNVDGLITSAAIQDDSVVILLGLNYTGGSKSFIWSFSKFSGSKFFSGNKRRFEIGNINTVGQVEAICFSDANKGFITNEGLSATPAQIREFDLNPFLIDNIPLMNYSFVTDTCNGLTNFTTSSINTPTSYFWDFGDGNISTANNPTHSFAMNGNYAVTLIGCNNFGCDTVVHNVAASVKGPKATTCYPETQTYCCGSGITHFRLFGPSGDIINNISDDADVSYEDFSCTETGTIITNSSYSLSCITGNTNMETIKVWLDLNNDGILDPVTEEIFSDMDTISNLHSGLFTIPTHAGNVYGIPLRMRVASDYQSIPEPCLDPEYGQHEDYSIVLNFSVDVNDLENETGFRIFPNPFVYNTTFDYTLNNSSLVTIGIYNVVGEKVESLLNSEMQTPGNYSYKTSGYSSGIYFLKLTINNESFVERIVKL